LQGAAVTKMIGMMGSLHTAVLQIVMLHFCQMLSRLLKFDKVIATAKGLLFIQMHTHTQPFYCSSGICPGPPVEQVPGRLKPSWIYWSKR